MIEQAVLAEHAARPGFTSRGFARSGSYDRLVAAVPAGARVLDLACGDGALLARLPPGAIGIDLSRDELALARTNRTNAERASRTTDVVLGRARALPFTDGSFDVVCCHLAFMLFDDIERVVAELGRVLAPGGSFIALLGGGPVAEPTPDDVFPAFIELMNRRGRPPLSLDRRARTERGWAELFAGWTVDPWERAEHVLDGKLDDVWAFLSATYGVEPGLRDELARRFTGDPIRCRAVTWLARATR